MITTEKQLHLKTHWRSLTWATLEDWAGLRSVERGREYCRAGRVTWFAVTDSGDLLASVRGGTRYSCRIRLDESGLRGRCTCPYQEAGCKHTIAAVLVYLDALYHDREVPRVEESEANWTYPELLESQPADKQTTPDSADALRQAIESRIAWPVPSACEEVLPLLRKLRSLLLREGRAEEWIAYEARLEGVHWRMREVLSRLRTRRIIPAFAASSAG